MASAEEVDGWRSGGNLVSVPISGLPQRPSSHAEPCFSAGPLWLGFDEAEPGGPFLAPGGPPQQPLLIGFDDEESADLELKATEPSDDVATPPHIRPTSAIALLASVAVHAAVLLALIQGSASQQVYTNPIPVRLVVVHPAAAPPLTPSPPQPTPAEAAIAAPPPTPVPRRAAASALPPQPVQRFPAQEVAVAAGHAADTLGLNATRAHYLAYLVMLTRRHLGLLPPSLVGSRHGETILDLLVHSDGTIARIAISHSSGYPEIDARVKQMLTAVGRFPPLPRWFRQPDLELNFRFRFPDALRHR